MCWWWRKQRGLAPKLVGIGVRKGKGETAQQQTKQPLRKQGKNNWTITGKMVDIGNQNFKGDTTQ